jgi:hypothetical protein
MSTTNTMNANTGTFKSTVDSGLPKRNSKQQFVGRLQPVSSRVPATPMVNFAKGKHSVCIRMKSFCLK